MGSMQYNKQNTYHRRFMTTVERMMLSINVDGPTVDVNLGPCWLWTGNIHRASDPAQGYGRVRMSSPRRYARAHRVFYEEVVGPVPKELVLDHLCRVHACVNPFHLEPVTQRVNLLRGETGPARLAARTECPKGHPYTPENTYVRKEGWRQCRTCQGWKGLTA